MPHEHPPLTLSRLIQLTALCSSQKEITHCDVHMSVTGELFGGGFIFGCLLDSGHWAEPKAHSFCLIPLSTDTEVIVVFSKYLLTPESSWTSCVFFYYLFHSNFTCVYSSDDEEEGGGGRGEPSSKAGLQAGQTGKTD